MKLAHVHTLSGATLLGFEFGPPPTSIAICVALDKFLHLSVPQFLHL